MKSTSVFIFIVGLICSSQSIFQFKPGHFSKYSLKINFSNKDDHSADITSELFFSKRGDQNYDLRWKNFQLIDANGVVFYKEGITPLVHSIKQPLQLRFNKFGLIEVNHEEAKSLMNQIFPFNYENSLEKIKKGESFEQNFAGIFVLPYSVKILEDFYELETSVVETEWSDPDYESPLFNASCHQLIRKDNFGLEKFDLSFEFGVAKGLKIKNLIEFKEFIESKDF